MGKEKDKSKSKHGHHDHHHHDDRNENHIQNQKQSQNQNESDNDGKHHGVEQPMSTPESSSSKKKRRDEEEAKAKSSSGKRSRKLHDTEHDIDQEEQHENGDQDQEELVFEDDYEDEYSDEEIIDGDDLDVDDDELDMDAVQINANIMEDEDKGSKDAVEEGALISPLKTKDVKKAAVSAVKKDVKAVTFDQLGSAARHLSNNPSVKQKQQEAEDMKKQKQQVAVWRHDLNKLQENEELVFDPSAYEMMHPINVEWPALSFDFVPSLNCEYQEGVAITASAAGGDNINASNHPSAALFQKILPLAPTASLSYPLTISMVMGTQADQAHNNQLVVLKLSHLNRTRPKKKHQNDDDDDDDDDESDSEESSDSDDSDDDMNQGRGGRRRNKLSALKNPILEHQSVKHKGTVNKVRCMPQNYAIAASWSDNSNVYITDLSPCFHALNRSEAGRNRMVAASDTRPSKVKPSFILDNHQIEGYALDWNPTDAGLLVTGDCYGQLFVSKLRPDGQGELTSHGGFHADSSAQASVEDVQWSPTEPTVFATCGVDKSIRFFDIRQSNRNAASLSMYNTHQSDVNVISWNRTESHLLVSGGDDGAISVWDLRSAKSTRNAPSSPSAHFTFHKSPITSISWHPLESSMLAASSEDHSISIWDLAVERDAEEELRLAGQAQEMVLGAQDIPPQLLFMHLGQKHIKEIRWHPVYTSLLASSAYDGLNVFRVADIF